LLFSPLKQATCETVGYQHYRKIETISLTVRAFSPATLPDAMMTRRALNVSTEVLRAGLKLYRDDCSGCHGDYQKPSQWGTTAFNPGVPQFASEPPDKPDGQMFWIVKNGVRFVVGAWAGEISDAIAITNNHFPVK
jgi:mono/diheme cytochrome c family protein